MWKIPIVLTTLWKISKDAFQIVDTISFFPQNYLIFWLWQYPLLIIWNIYSTFLQICWYFHISFRNLKNFFCEHARGARAIFHVCTHGPLKDHGGSWTQWGYTFVPLESLDTFLLYKLQKYSKYVKFSPVGTFAVSLVRVGILKWF